MGKMRIVDQLAQLHMTQRQTHVSAGSHTPVVQHTKDASICDIKLGTPCSHLESCGRRK